MADKVSLLRQPPVGCLPHTDRGAHYCSGDYQKKAPLGPFLILLTLLKYLKARNRWETRRKAEGAIFNISMGSIILDDATRR